MYGRTIIEAFGVTSALVADDRAGYWLLLQRHLKSIASVDLHPAATL